MTDAKSPAEIGDVVSMTLQLSGTPDGQYEATIEADHGEHVHAMGLSMVRYGATLIAQTSEYDQGGRLNREVTVRQFDSAEVASECFDALKAEAENAKEFLSDARVDGMFAAAAAAMAEDRESFQGYSV